MRASNPGEQPQEQQVPEAERWRAGEALQAFFLALLGRDGHSPPQHLAVAPRRIVLVLRRCGRLVRCGSPAHQVTMAQLHIPQAEAGAAEAAFGVADGGGHIRRRELIHSHEGAHLCRRLDLVQIDPLGPRRQPIGGAELLNGMLHLGLVSARLGRSGDERLLRARAHL